MSDKERIADAVDRLTLACIDPDGPLYGSDIVPWIDDVLTDRKRLASDLTACRSHLETLTKDSCDDREAMAVLCRQAGIAENRIVGDSHGVPGIMDLAEMLGTELASVRSMHNELTSFDKAERIKLQSELAACREELERANRQSALAIADKADLRASLSAAVEALRPVVREAKGKGIDYEHSSWNPNAHIELTLTIREMRAISSTHDTAQAQREKS